MIGEAKVNWGRIRVYTWGCDCGCGCGCAHGGQLAGENRGGRDAVLGHPVSLALDHLPGTHVDAEEVAVEEAVEDVGVDGVDECDDGFLL